MSIVAHSTTFPSSVSSDVDHMWSSQSICKSTETNVALETTPKSARPLILDDIRHPARVFAMKWNCHK